MRRRRRRGSCDGDQASHGASRSAMMRGRPGWRRSGAGAGREARTQRRAAKSSPHSRAGTMPLSRAAASSVLRPAATLPGMPMFCVIMPLYNHEAFVDEAIGLVVKQTIGDGELIVVDDGSKDRSGEIADRWAASEPRIRVIHQANAGPAAAAVSWTYCFSPRGRLAACCCGS